MKRFTLAGGVAAVAVAAFAVLLYAVHPVRSSDHQDTYNLANRSNTSADITDVYVFPSKANPNNVVLAMNVMPLIPAGMGASRFFDPTLMWQFKIAHGTSNYQEDQVIQFGVSGTGAGQTITVYGPAKPAEVGTTNTFVASSGSFTYNTNGNLSNGVTAFAGPRADPFFFDLFQFFSFLGDRYFATHNSQSDPGPGNTLTNGNNVGVAAQVAPPYEKNANPNQPTFNGFAAGTLSGGSSGYACSTNAPVNALADVGGGFNVLSLVVEVPKSLLTTGFSSPVIHVWATANSSTGA